MKIRDNLDPIVKFLCNHVRGGLIFLMAMLPLGGVPLARTFRSHEEDELRECLEPLLDQDPMVQRNSDDQYQVI